MSPATEGNSDKPVFGARARDRKRLDALHRYDILDTRPEAAFDRLTDLATGFFDVDVAFMAFLDTDRQWFKSSVGLNQTESTLAASFCTHTIEAEDLLVIEDATKDERVDDSPFVTDAGLRFYAGVPITTPEGPPIGTFSVMHSDPRTLSEKETRYLKMLAEMATDELETRRDAQKHAQLARRFEAVFQDPNVLAGVLAPDGTLLDTNETSLQYVDATEEAVIGEPFWETPWWPSRMQEEVKTWVERAAAGEYVEYEADLTTPEGRPFSVDGTVRPVTDPDGTITSLIVSARDVTARTRREHELRRQRHLLEQTQRLAGAWEADLQEGTMTWSETVYEIHEVPPNTDIDIEDGIQFYAPEARPRIRAAFQRCIERREPYDLELPLITAKGTRRWVRTVGAPIETKNGTVVKVAGAFQDVTERKTAEDELKETKRFYEQILEHIPIDLAVFTPEARVEYVNPQSVSDEETRDWILGRTNEEYCKKRGFAPAIGRRRDAAIRTAARENAITEIEETLQTDSDPHHFLRVQSPVTNLDGDVTHVVGFGIDITERKRREQALLGREQKIEALYTATEHFLKAETPKEVAVRIEEVIRETFDYPLNGVHFARNDQLVPVQVSPNIVDRWPDMPSRNVSGSGIGARAYRSGKTVVSDDLQALDTTIDYQDLQSGAAVPLGVHGVITVGSTEKETIESFDVNLMEILAADAAAVLDRIERERTLQKKERRYRAVFEDPNILVGLLDPDGRVLDVNRTALDYVGAPLNDIIGEPFWTTPWFEGDEALQDAVQEWIQRANAGEYAEFEADLSKAVGAPLVISGVVRPVTDEEGTVTSLLVTDRDVTARKQDRRRLERYREYTDRLINASDDLFFVCNENGCLQRWNERVATVTGYSEEELDGMTVLDFVHADDRERTRAAVDEVFERGRSQVEALLVPKDGSPIPYEFAANCVEHPDGDLRLVGIGRDVTERKQRERSLVEAKQDAEEAHRLKSAMLANMSHEIRTPLTSITGFAEVIEEELDGRLNAFARRIYQSGQRLMKTLDSVLQLSKLEAGAYDLEREPLSLDRLVEDTTELLRPSAAEKAITLTTAVQDSPIPGRWNEGALNRILENLLENAIKFTPEGGRVEVRTWAEDNAAVLEVEDTGVGIRKEALSEIFEAFKQESEGLTREYEGSGLGLPIVQRLVDAHGGALTVDTEKGGGSCFTVRLPQSPTDETPSD